MNTNTPLFKLVLVTHSQNGKTKVTIKDESDNEVYLMEEKKRLQARRPRSGADYRIVGPTLYKRLMAEVE
jgi:hypothetical protein